MIGKIHLACAVLITAMVYSSLMSHKIIGAVSAVATPIIVANIIIISRFTIYELGAFYQAIAIFWSLMDILISVLMILTVEAVADYRKM
jgi:hypothetical protein